MVGHCFARCKARCLLLVARRRRLVAELAADADCAEWMGAWQGMVTCQAELMGAGAYIAGATMMTKERAFTLRRSPAQCRGMLKIFTTSSGYLLAVSTNMDH